MNIYNEITELGIENCMTQIEKYGGVFNVVEKSIEIESLDLIDCIKQFNDVLSNKKNTQFNFAIDFDMDLYTYYIIYNEYVIISMDDIMDKVAKLSKKFATFVADEYRNPQYEGAVKARGFIAEYKSKHNMN